MLYGSFHLKMFTYVMPLLERPPKCIHVFFPFTDKTLEKNEITSLLNRLQKDKASKGGSKKTSTISSAPTDETYQVTRKQAAAFGE